MKQKYKKRRRKTVVSAAIGVNEDASGDTTLAVFSNAVVVLVVIRTECMFV